MSRGTAVAVVVSVHALACGVDAPVGGAPAPNAAPAPRRAGADAGASAEAGPLDAGPAKPLSFVAMTFNTGTAPELDHDAPPDDGYTSDAADVSNDFYGNGLAWNMAIADVKAFIAQASPDVIAFQEIFHPGECVAVPVDKRAGFVCETWKEGEPTVAQAVVGAGYQVACNLGKPDKCVAVKASFGTLRGCSGDLCLEGMGGAAIAGCGGGARIGRGVVDLVAGGAFTLVSVHGSSGFKAEDVECRKKQVEQVFTALDGAPAANGARNVVLGDFNTDPGRLASLDESAKRWNDYVGPASAFRFVTDVGPNAPGTYGTSLGPITGSGLSIDHVVSDAFTGACWYSGVTPGKPDVTAMRYFDHKAIVCTLTEK